jgi:hypothetical protein
MQEARAEQDESTITARDLEMVADLRPDYVDPSEVKAQEAKSKAQERKEAKAAGAAGGAADGGEGAAEAAGEEEDDEGAAKWSGKPEERGKVLSTRKLKTGRMASILLDSGGLPQPLPFTPHPHPLFSSSPSFSC